jgi:hypothetical protein
MLPSLESSRPAGHFCCKWAETTETKNKTLTPFCTPKIHLKTFATEAQAA